MTNKLRVSFGMTKCSYYDLCKNATESILHVFQDCPFAKEI